MDMRSIRFALAALDAGSFAKAAEGLYVSRQALSQAVRHLEDEIDVPLFEVADGNRIVATAEGAVFLAQARHVAEAFDELARENDALCFAFPESMVSGRWNAAESVLVPLDAPESARFGTYAVRRRDSRRTPAARRFWAYACESASGCPGR